MMKNLSIMLLLFVLSVLSVRALEWDKCLQYKFQSADPATAWVLQDDGAGVFIKQWNLPDPQPTKAELEAVEVQALAWYDDKTKTKEADFETWDKAKLKALVLVMMNELNILRAKHGLAPRTTVQLKAAIKSKL